MNTRIISFITITCFAGAFALLVWTPASHEQSERVQSIERRLVDSYRCIECNPNGEPYTPSEALSSAPDDNARSFKTVITKVKDGKHYMEFETKRLIFRELTMNDIDAVYRYARKPMVAARTAWPAHTNKVQTIRKVESWVNAYHRGLFAPWGIEEKATGELIGTAGIPLFYVGNHRAQLAYCLSDTAWGNKYEVEVVRALIEYAFVQAKVKGRVEALARTDDPFTQKVLEQAGMSREGVVPAHKKVGDEYFSFYFYAVVRRDIAPALNESSLR